MLLLSTFAASLPPHPRQLTILPCVCAGVETFEVLPAQSMLELTLRLAAPVAGRVDLVEKTIMALLDDL